MRFANRNAIPQLATVRPPAALVTNPGVGSEKMGQRPDDEQSNQEEKDELHTSMVPVPGWSTERSLRIPRNRDDQRDDEDRDDVRDLDHRVDRRARRVLVRVSYGV